jgi:hypothetical protein
VEIQTLILFPPVRGESRADVGLSQSPIRRIPISFEPPLGGFHGISRGIDPPGVIREPDSGLFRSDNEKALRADVEYKNKTHPGFRLALFIGDAPIFINTRV